jgi:acetylornithine deacetylase/succinyl-diaminopimelate desuccinylase-like protein
MIRPSIRTLGVAAALALSGATPQAVTPAAAQAPPQLDSAHLLADLSVLAHDSMEGREVGTLGSLRARHFLEHRLEETGARPFGSSFGQPFSWPRGTGENVVGLVAGRDPDAEVIVLTAHYDHVGIRDGVVFNGADDNASGTAALLEIARQLVADPPRHPVVVALLDAEEAGAWGARALVDDPPVPLERIALNVNLDMVARTGGVLWAAGAYHTPALRPILEDVAARAPLTLRLGHDRPEAPEGDDWTGSSDHAAFHGAGIPFVYFGVEDHEDYHRPTDDFERVDPAELVASVRTILLAVRALDADLPLDLARP